VCIFKLVPKQWNCENEFNNKNSSKSIGFAGSRGSRLPLRGDYQFIKNCLFVSTLGNKTTIELVMFCKQNYNLKIEEIFSLVKKGLQRKTSAVVAWQFGPITLRQFIPEAASLYDREGILTLTTSPPLKSLKLRSRDGTSSIT
jgi:hypothetical protein